MVATSMLQDTFLEHRRHQAKDRRCRGTSREIPVESVQPITRAVQGHSHTMADGVEYSGASCNLPNRLMYEHTAMYEHPMTTVIERVPLRLGFQRSSWTPKTSSTRSQMPRHIQEIRVLHWSWCGQQLEIRSNALSCAVF